MQIKARSTKTGDLYNILKIEWESDGVTVKSLTIITPDETYEAVDDPSAFELVPIENIDTDDIVKENKERNEKFKIGKY